MSNINKKRGVSIQEIIDFLSKDILLIHGDPKGRYFQYLKDPRDVDEDTLDWIGSTRQDKQNMAEASKAQAIIATSDLTYSDKLKVQGKLILIVENPKLAIAKIGNAFFVDRVIPSIHPSAVIHSEAIIGRDVFIGPNVTIGKCIIGDRVEIHPNTVIYDDVVLSNNVHIYSNASIGIDGLGCEREEDGRLVKFPHLGRLIIENNVEIGAGCMIAKGGLSATIIGSGTKINAGCFIAHNGVLGRNVWISPKVNIAGSVKIDDNVTIFSGAIIREQRKIGKGSIIGMGSIVTKNIPEGETWIGNPARKLEKR